MLINKKFKIILPRLVFLIHVKATSPPHPEKDDNHCHPQRCEENKLFDAKTCDCECKKKEPFDGCKFGQAWNATLCRCQCPIVEHCPSPKTWDHALCQCRCQENCHGDVKCEGKQIWCEESCACRCPHPMPPNGCPGSQT